MNIKRKSKWISVFVSFLFIFVFFTLLINVFETSSINVKADTEDVISSSCGIPIIDGKVNALEWSAATTMAIPMVTAGPTTTLTTNLYVMNSANYLYMGLTIDDDEFTELGQYLPEGDEFVIIFDNDHTGSVYDLNNNVVALSAGEPKYEDRYIYNVSGSNQADTEGGGTADGTGMTGRSSDLNHFEMKFPLCSGDTLDFCLSSTDVIGFRLEYLDAEGNGDFGGSHYYPDTGSTSQADLVIGTCTAIKDMFVYLPLIVK
jgi:hypothetical protein